MAALNSAFRAGIVVVVACIFAIVAGFAVSDPLAQTGMITLAVLLFVPLVPVLLRWHHPLLLVTWNFQMVLFFLRTEPRVRDVMIVWSTIVIFLQFALDKKNRFQVHWPLIRPMVIVVVGVFIAILSNHSLGAIVGQGSFGGKRYLHVILALLGCFVLGAVRISPKWRVRVAVVFFLSNISYAVGDAFYLVGAPPILQMLFPSQIGFYEGMALGALSRYAGIGWAAMCVVMVLQMYYGVRGLLDFSRPWRGAGYLLFLGIALLGGHRVALVLPLLIFLVQFFMEGLYRTKYAAYMIVFGGLALSAAVIFSENLPIAVQRALSFLPGKKSALAIRDAEGTFEWRWEMWDVVFPQVPQVMWTGKGYLYSPVDQELAELGASTYIYSSFESSMVDGTYHQGFLTVIVPLGITTFFGFTWFLWVGFKVLRNNLKYGDSTIRKVNLFVYSAFIARVIFYFIMYGQFDTDLEVFAGLIGLSMALNGGALGSRPRREPELPARVGLAAEPVGAN